jgi:hypothetical protein
MESCKLRFDVYGRFIIELCNERGAWQAYRVSEGKRVRDYDVVIPADLAPAEIAVYLDDLFHEWARPGQEVRQVQFGSR